MNRTLGEFREKRWQDIKVGDLVKVNKDEEIPADMLCVVAPKQVVFVSTMNLDGETNLKDRELALSGLKEESLTDFKGMVECDKPNASIDVWDANLLPPIGGSSNIPKTKSCSIKNLLLRGCTLKNTPYVYGVVVYVGMHTKIYQNSTNPERKVSNLMKTMNKILYSVFIFQVIIIAVYSTAGVWWLRERKGTHKYLSADVKRPEKEGFCTSNEFCTWGL